jgi:hypothetical protein
MMFHLFQFRRDEFLAHYHKRSNVETTFSMIKAKFRDHVRRQGRRLDGQRGSVQVVKGRAGAITGRRLSEVDPDRGTAGAVF